MTFSNILCHNNIQTFSLSFIKLKKVYNRSPYAYICGTFLRGVLRVQENSNKDHLSPAKAVNWHELGKINTKLSIIKSIEDKSKTSA